MFAPIQKINHPKIENCFLKIIQYQDKIDNIRLELDECFMEDFIKPFCKKYGLSFKSYNGTYVLLTKKGNIIDLESKNHMNSITTFWNAVIKIDNQIRFINDETKFMGNCYWFENENFDKSTGIFDEMR